jgi:unsaturated rhamnogalacturonyl hydrolase
MVESTMARSPGGLGRWEYSRALYLWGQYLVWKRTRDPRHFNYVKTWVDSHISSSGSIDTSIPRLDNILPGNLAIAMYRETGQARYKAGADTVRRRFNSYPRSSDGGFLHQTKSSMKGELWADGLYMAVPFLARYGTTFNDAAYTNDEIAKQLVVYTSHLESPAGLVYHAWDQDGSASWAGTGNHSPEFWCRAVGWYGMALVETIETLPPTHPRRAELIGNLQALVAALARYQDPVSGRWFQIMDKGSLSNNWTETSCSSMHTYTVSRAVQLGYVDARYASVAQKGFRGVLEKISVGSDGRTNLRDICEGTDAGSSVSYYLGRPRSTNDMHGLGAFLIMYEQLR